MFDEEFPKNIPPRRLFDYTIPIKDRNEYPAGALYGIIQEEIRTLKE
jgi:hypothetical protein